MTTSNTSNNTEQFPPLDQWYQPTLTDEGGYFYWGMDDLNPEFGDPIKQTVRPLDSDEWTRSIMRLVALAATVVNHDLADAIVTAKRRNTPEDDESAIRYARAQHSVGVVARELTHELFAPKGDDGFKFSTDFFHLSDGGVQLLIRSTMLNLLRNVFDLVNLDGTASTLSSLANDRYGEGMQTSDALMNAAATYVKALPDDHPLAALKEVDWDAISGVETLMDDITLHALENEMKGEAEKDGDSD